MEHEERFSVCVSDVNIPTHGFVETYFPVPGSVAAILTDRHVWKEYPRPGDHQRRQDTLGDNEFLLKCFGRPMLSIDAIAEMVSRGWYPVTHVEQFFFARQYREEQTNGYRIVALGSMVPVSEETAVVVALSSQHGAPVFNEICWYDEVWPADTRFLFTLA